jgi:small subunit ribosomal protein S9
MAEGERPNQQSPDAPEEAPAEEPIAPDEQGRSQPAEGGEEPEGPAEAETSAETGGEPPAESEGAPAAEAEVQPPGEAEVAPEPEEAVEEGPRQRPEIPGADLEVDIVLEGHDPLGRDGAETALEDYEAPQEVEEPVVEPAEEPEPETRPKAVIDLAAHARYRATGKRKTSVARVILRPGDGKYLVNGGPLEEHFPRPTLQRNIRQPLETVGYDSRMDVVAKLHGGGVSSQAGALRHGIARALIEADPNLRSELKRRGFLTRDPRVKERKKAGLKKARKRPQFSKR